jgi:hypothetical protein
MAHIEQITLTVLDPMVVVLDTLFHQKPLRIYVTGNLSLVYHSSRLFLTHYESGLLGEIACAYLKK